MMQSEIRVLHTSHYYGKLCKHYNNDEIWNNCVIHSFIMMKLKVSICYYLLLYY